MKTRGKFLCGSVKSFAPAGGAKTYEFYAVSNDGTPENERFHKYTPFGKIEISVDNPAVNFEPGKYYYVDFTAVENA